MLVDIHPTSRVEVPEDHDYNDAEGICILKYGASHCFSPQCKAYYFDVDAKLWKPLPSVVQSDEETSLCFCAERIGNYFFVAEQKQGMLKS